MTQRTLAGLIAVPLVLVLLALAWLTPLPYVVYSPGPTVDVLGEVDDEPIVEISGGPTYADDGQLRMTTVSVTQPEADVDLFTLLKAWVSDDQAVYPYASVYEEGTTTEANQCEGSAQMASSEKTAAAAAINEVGGALASDLTEDLEVLAVCKGTPSDGRLEVGDQLTRVNGEAVTTPAQAVDQITGAEPGRPVRLDVVRDGKPRTVTVEPETDAKDGKPRIGVTLGMGYDLPLDVKVNIGEDIGGPSAGLMFSLAIYDTLTEGSLTDGREIAGTGTIDGTGTVGPIGGIQQKIAGARRDGAELFLVPADNCADALGAEAGSMRLVRTETLHDAVESLTTWADDPDADLPTCEADAA